MNNFSTIIDVRTSVPVSLWEDENFLALHRVALENIENMNPDSLVKLLAAIKLKKGQNEHLKILYDNIIDWVIVSFKITSNPQSW